MMWWVVLGVLVVASVVFFAVNHYRNTWEEWPVACGATSCILAMVVLLTCIVGSLSTSIKIDRFERAKAYVETRLPGDPLEDVALTNKKIELNEWLFDAQARKTTYGTWSFYPESVLELEPIK